MVASSPYDVCMDVRQLHCNSILYYNLLVYIIIYIYTHIVLYIYIYIYIYCLVSIGLLQVCHLPTLAIAIGCICIHIQVIAIRYYY